MGMSGNVVGVDETCGEFAKMLGKKVACDEAGIDYPAEVATYFSDEHSRREDGLWRHMEERRHRIRNTRSEGDTI